MSERVTVKERLAEARRRIYWTNVSLLRKLEEFDWGAILDNKGDGHARRGHGLGDATGAFFT
jgi:hypothetical protein